MATQTTQELEALLKSADVLMDEMATRMTVINTYRTRLDSVIAGGLSWFQTNVSVLTTEPAVKTKLQEAKDTIDSTMKTIDKAEQAFLQTTGSINNLMNTTHEMLALFKQHVDRILQD